VCPGQRDDLLRAVHGARLGMVDGMAQTLQVATRSLVTTAFDDFAYDLAGLAGVDAGRRQDPRELSTPVLLAAGRAAQVATGADVAKLRFEGHARFSEAIFAFGLPLLAFGFLMLGGYSRLGLWRQILGAVVAAIILKMLSNVAENAARGDADLWWLTYVPAGLTVALGAILVWRDTRGPRLIRATA